MNIQGYIMLRRKKEIITCMLLVASVLWIDLIPPNWEKLLRFYYKHLTETKPISFEHTSGVFLSHPSLNILNCSDVIPKPRIERRSGFYVYYNYITSRRYFRCHESVTFTTHLQSKIVANIKELAERWQGPISISVVVTSNNYQLLLDKIMHLRKCESPLVDDFVTFHFIFKDSDFPEKIFNPKEIPGQFKNICETSDSQFREPPEIGQAAFINLARNVAVEGSLTHFVVSSDLYLYPSPDFMSKFFNFLHEHPDLVLKQIAINEDYNAPKFSNLFVLPIFIIGESFPLPWNKEELVQLKAKKKAAIFSTDASPFNQHFADYNKWVEKEEDGQLEVVASGRTKMFLYDWEPVYVGTKMEPEYDEEIVMEGPHSKYSKYVRMCCAGYLYHVLDEAYLLLKEQDAPYYRPDQNQIRQEVSKIKERLQLEEEIKIKEEHRLELIQKEIDILSGIIEQLKPVCLVPQCSSLPRKYF